MKPRSESPVRLLDQESPSMAGYGKVRKVAQSDAPVNPHGIAGVRRGLDCSFRRHDPFVQARYPANDNRPPLGNWSAGVPGLP